VSQRVGLSGREMIGIVSADVLATYLKFSKTHFKLDDSLGLQAARAARHRTTRPRRGSRLTTTGPAAARPSDLELASRCGHEPFIVLLLSYQSIP
jgi:hypothetical protein